MKSNNPRPIELLAPAKNTTIGMEAINHGADAVYIGAPSFSARAAAGNSIADIEELSTYAHRYGARIYVALNTLLKDEELPEAQRIITQLYEAGADALIVQDMGILQLDLPPIALHASTQTDNRTPEKVRFLQEAGFSQVVLARELSHQEIANIASQTSVALEAFVHGALCVSYSGQCYLSHYLSGRSANRGACAQYCRLPYSLVDGTGKELIANKHLLSLKDLNLSDRLEAMLEAGVSSLKIEGRLKDMSYVKNVTGYYRQKLDAILSRRANDYRAASWGTTRLSFDPQPSESFNRGFTHYFFEGRGAQPIISPNTPKSLGMPLGKVKRVEGKRFQISGASSVNNGDGLVYFTPEGVLDGFRVNRAEGNLIYPATMPPLQAGTPLYRNYNHAFETLLTKKSAERTLAIDLELTDTPSGYLLRCTSEAGDTIEVRCDTPKEEANTPQEENQKRQLSRWGGTLFEARNIALSLQGNPFIPSSLLAQLRRDACEAMVQERLKNHLREVRQTPLSHPTFPTKKLTYLGNVMNNQARLFYQEHGVTEAIDSAFELTPPTERVPLMFTRFCLRHHLGACRKNKESKVQLQEPLYLTYKERRLELEFNCARCEMRILPTD